MLGSLARWLRILALDVRYDPELDDAAIVELAAAEGRTILTRDRRLIERRLARDYLLIRSQRLERQLRQVLDECGVEATGARRPRRCVPCNGELQPLAPERARPLVPPYVAASQRRFRRCPDCGRVYWAATHAAQIRRKLAAMGIAPLS